MSKDHDAPAYTARWAQLHGGPVAPAQPGAPEARAIPLREAGRAPVGTAEAAQSLWTTAPECVCAIGSTCRTPGCCYKGETVPADVRSALEPPPRDPIVAKVTALLLSRSAVGIAKYGVTLARDDLSRKEWLTHARDEALDCALYLQRLIEMEDGV